MRLPGALLARRRVLVLSGVAVVLVALVVGVAAAALSGGGRQEMALPDPTPGRAGMVVLPVVPVGGDMGAQKQTLDGALAEVSAAARAGVGGIRMAADLSWLCAPQGCDLSPLEPVVERARQLGLRVYLQVNRTPSWLGARGPWDGPVGGEVARWATLFGDVVARFGTEVAGYEVWNEPNNPEFWQQGPDPGAYADLLKAVWTDAKRIEPRAQLVGGVLSNNDLGYMHALDAALVRRGGNAVNHFFYDQLGVHPYAGGPAVGYDPRRAPGSAEGYTEFGVKDMTFRGVERLRGQVRADEGLWRDVVIGEFGYTTDPGAWYHVAEPQRSEYLTAALRIAAGWTWVTAFTVYGYRDATPGGFALDGTPSMTALQQEIDRLR